MRLLFHRTTLTCLGLLAVWAAAGIAGEAGSPDEDSATLDPIVVTATRREMLLSDVPDVLRVVTRSEIEELRPSSTGEIMEYLPGVTAETGTGSGLPKRTVIGLNGLPPNYTLVLVDGVRLLSEHIHTGQNIESIPPESIERIEVIRGAASAQYGADAIGGVVNIITRKCGTEGATSLGFSGGSYNTYVMDAALYKPLSENARVSVHLLREQSHGVPLLQPEHRIGNMGYERHIAMARMDIDVSESTSLFGWVNAVDNTSDWREADTDSDLNTAALGMSHKLAETLTLNSQFSYSMWSAEASEEENHWFQQDLNLVWNLSEAQTLTFGGDYRRNEFLRSAVAHTPGQDAVGSFLQHELRIGQDFTVMTALRVDAVEDVETAVSPKVSLLYSPEMPFRLRGSVSRGFHAPTLQELYEVGYGHGGAALRFGNEDLDPEYSMTYAVGLEFFPTETLQFSVYGHYSEITDMIVPVYEGVWVVDPTKEVWRRTNIDDARVCGVEVSGRYVVSPNLRLEAGYTWTDTEDKESGYQLPYHPGSSAFAKAITQWKLNADWKLSGFVGLRAVEDRSAWNWKPPSGAPVGDPSGMITNLDDYQKLDAGVAIDFRDRLSVYLNLYNLLEQDIENLDDAYTVLDGEVTFKFGFRWNY